MARAYVRVSARISSQGAERGSAGVHCSFQGHAFNDLCSPTRLHLLIVFPVLPSLGTKPLYMNLWGVLLPTIAGFKGCSAPWSSQTVFFLHSSFRKPGDLYGGSGALLCNETSNRLSTEQVILSASFIQFSKVRMRHALVTVRTTSHLVRVRDAF